MDRGLLMLLILMNKSDDCNHASIMLTKSVDSEMVL